MTAAEEKKYSRPKSQQRPVTFEVNHLSHSFIKITRCSGGAVMARTIVRESHRISQSPMFMRVFRSF
jgi:hypothetical protein